MGINEVIQVGNKIKAVRQSKGYTQKQVAELSGIPYSTYSNYENNNREPSITQLKKIAGALEIPVNDLLTFERLEKELSIAVEKVRNSEAAIREYLCSLSKMLNGDALWAVAGIMSEMLENEENWSRFFDEEVIKQFLKSQKDNE